MRQVLATIRGRDEWRTSDLLTEIGGKQVLTADKPDPITERQVRRNLKELFDIGFLDRRKEGCGWVWEDDSLCDVNSGRQVLFKE
jgi:DNA-binding HxlR family transcriptional regulator